MLAAAGLLSISVGRAADWLSVRSDPRASAYQHNETIINVENVGKIGLLWRQQLDTPNSRLSDPIMLGPIVTDHGVKELVFVGSTNNVYAVDADLGRVFWTRALAPDLVPRQSTCQTAGSLVMHRYAEDDAQPTSSGDDEYSDGDRPLYALSNGGHVFVLRPRTGGDLIPAFRFIDSGFAAHLLEDGEALFGTSSKVCDGPSDELWSTKVGISGVDVSSASSHSQTTHGLTPPLAAFEWKKHLVGIVLGLNTEPSLVPVSTQSPLFAGERDQGGVATWRDKLGTQWICVASGQYVRKYRVRETSGTLEIVPIWSVDRYLHARAPVVANGIVYFLAQSAQTAGHLVLHALDVKDGKELYSSQADIAEQASSGKLAIANGHVCFTAEPAALTCFGLPFVM